MPSAPRPCWTCSPESGSASRASPPSTPFSRRCAITWGGWLDPKYRAPFNAQINPQRYEWYQRELERRLDCTFEFRLAESPVFLPDDFKARIVGAAEAIVEQLSDPSNIAQMKRAIPARWDTPGMDALPN